MYSCTSDDESEASNPVVDPEMRDRSIIDRQMSTRSVRDFCGTFQGGDRVKVRFNPSVETFDVSPYSEVYGIHPKDFEFFANAGIVHLRLSENIVVGSLRAEWPTPQGDLEVAAKGERQRTCMYTSTEGRMHSHPLSLGLKPILAVPPQGRFG